MIESKLFHRLYTMFMGSPGSKPAPVAHRCQRHGDTIVVSADPLVENSDEIPGIEVGLKRGSLRIIGRLHDGKQQAECDCSRCVGLTYFVDAAVLNSLLSQNGNLECSFGSGTNPALSPSLEEDSATCQRLEIRSKAERSRAVEKGRIPGALINISAHPDWATAYGKYKWSNHLNRRGHLEDEECAMLLHEVLDLMKKCTCALPLDWQLEIFLSVVDEEHSCAFLAYDGSGTAEAFIAKYQQHQRDDDEDEDGGNISLEERLARVAAMSLSMKACGKWESTDLGYTARMMDRLWATIDACAFAEGGFEQGCKRFLDAMNGGVDPRLLERLVTEANEATSFMASGLRLGQACQALYMRQSVLTHTSGTIWRGEPGCGKTWPCIEAARHLNSDVVVVTGPKGTFGDPWVKDIQARDPKAKIVAWTDGRLGKRVKILRNKRELRSWHPELGTRTYLLINPEKYQCYSDDAVRDAIRDMICGLCERANNPLFIIDELQKFKSSPDPEGMGRVALMCEIIKRLHEIGVPIHGLTGTIAVKDLEDAKNSLELVTGQKYDHIDPKLSGSAVLKLRAALSEIGYRFYAHGKPKMIFSEEARAMGYRGHVVIVPLNSEIKQRIDNVSGIAEKERISIRNEMDYLRTDAKFDALTRSMRTFIVYSHYVDEKNGRTIVGEIENWAASMGRKVFHCIGGADETDKWKAYSGKSILIGGQSLAEGRNGLQKKTNFMLVLGQGHTPGQRAQLEARVNRQQQAPKFGGVVHIWEVIDESAEHDLRRLETHLKRQPPYVFLQDGVFPARAHRTREEMSAALIASNHVPGTVHPAEKKPLESSVRKGGKKANAQQRDKETLMNSLFGRALTNTVRERIDSGTAPCDAKVYYCISSKRIAKWLRNWGDTPEARVIRKALKRNPNARILIMGCSPETLDIPIPSTANVTYLDILLPLLPGYEDRVLRADMANTGLDAGGFDVVISVLSLFKGGELGKTAKRVISEMHRLLASGGEVWITKSKKNDSSWYGKEIPGILKAHKFRLLTGDSWKDFTTFHGKKSKA